MAEELETKVENTEETHDSNNEGRQWYVVNTYSGHENKVKKILKNVLNQWDFRISFSIL